MKLKLSFLLFIIYASLWAQPPHTFTANGSLVVPAGITSMTVQAWGAGGAGGAASQPAALTGSSGAGGGGGAYAAATITVVAGNTINAVVGGSVAGSTGNGGNGAASTITGFETSILAAGGSGGTANLSGGAPAGGVGGLVANSVGTTRTAGVNGGNGATSLLSLLFTSGAGGNAGNTAGGGGTGGAAIASVIGGVTSAGNLGNPPGGGGSGAMNGNVTATQVGGAGARGQVVINYTCPTYNISSNAATNVCITSGTSIVTLTSTAALLPIGVYTITYNRSSPAGTALTAPMTVASAGTGTFTASGLTTAGSSTITITALTSGSCVSTISANNTATVTVSPATVGGSVTGGTTICSGSTSALLTLAGNIGTVVKWQSSVSPFSTWADIPNTTTTYTSGALTQTTQFRAVVQSGICVTADSNFTTVIVNPLPTITLGSVAAVCTSANSQNTILAYTATTNSPTTYSISWNASPTNSFAVVTNAALNASPISIAVPAGTAAGTYNGTITVRNGNGCTSSPGVNFNVIVNPLPAAPTIGTITLPTCLVSTGSIALSGLPSGGILTRYPGAIVEPYTGTTVTISGLSPDTYTFTVSNGTCISLISANVVVPGLVTNTYTTSWSNGTPTPDQNIVFAGNFVSAGGGTGDISACSCIVNPGVNITIQSLDTLTLMYSLSNNGGTLTFENSSSLLQTTNASNIGNIVYQRTTTPIRQGDFVYWSTPVNPQRLIDVSPLTPADKYLGYNGTNWVITNPNSNMIVGKGYIIRGPQNYSNTANVTYTASFIGKPNNGDIVGETLASGNYYLIGNPYPSALDSNLFLAANTFLDGTLYFWTNNTPVVLVGAYQYNSNDYASYNLTGGVGTGLPAPSGTPQNNDDIPTGKIAAGQSFFAITNSAGIVTFNNAMRLGGTDNSQFFKSTEETEKHRVWLNMTNSGGAFKQMLLGYVEDATNDYESKFDGKTFDGNPYLDFYSIDSNNKYVIQGRALPFTDTDIVPLGYRSTIAGDFTISIDHADGNLSNHAIYLEDKITNSVHNLQQSSYTFSTSTGTFTDRFVLRYTNKTLGTGEFETNNKNIMVAVQNRVIMITSDIDKISNVSIYDPSGKLIHRKTNLSENVVKVDNLRVQNQVLLVKMTLDTDTTKTYKIVY